VMSGTVAVPPAEKGGGNFIFLTAANLNDGRNGHLTANFIPGAYGGHNVVAPSKNVGADPVLTHAPGGTYMSSSMSCTSCHNPHGNTNFRLLYGVSHVEAGNYTFTHAAPDAEGISIEDTLRESSTHHTAYKGGMSAWCANCHGNYHNNTTQMVHPSGQAMGANIAQTYGLYNGTAHPNGGTPSSSYLPMVAFEDGAMTTSSTGAPSATSQVSCISCHRAHGSSAPNIGRWDFNIGTWAAEGVESATYAIPNPWNDPAQRSACNKCHARDAGDQL
jgi:hypothetical protein